MLYAEPACARFPLRARSLSPQRHRVATRLLNVGLGFFLVILHAAYTANLAAFLGDREVGDYWESIEDATSAGAKICAHLILQPTLEAQYPVPTPFLRHKGESVEQFHARLLTEFAQYLDTYANEIGVLLVEPQWGSSVAAMPWPPKLLKAYIAAAKERGIAVVCDEVMCGLGRHGAEPNGGSGCFLSECWDLQPDCVTFGKVKTSP